MSKAYAYGFVAGLVLLIVAGVIGFQAQRQDPEEETYRAEIVDATPAQVGMLTAKQHIHSKLYPDYLQQRGNRTISEIVAEAKGRTKIVTLIAAPGLEPVINEPETPENYFGKLAHEADIVIRGRVAKKESYITEDEGYILTDYDVVVTEVFKNNAIAPFDNGTTITITRPGGKVVLEGILVKAVDEAFAPLPRNQEVVFFLQFIPETGAYKEPRYNGYGSFELDGSVLRPLTKSKFPPGVLQDARTFLQTTRAISKE